MTTQAAKWLLSQYPQFSEAQARAIVDGVNDELTAELAALREQSAREHAAWEAVRTKLVHIVQWESPKDRIVVQDCCGLLYFANDPVDAVLEAVAAGKEKP